MNTTTRPRTLAATVATVASLICTATLTSSCSSSNNNGSAVNTAPPSQHTRTHSRPATSAAPTAVIPTFATTTAPSEPGKDSGSFTIQSSEGITVDATLTLSAPTNVSTAQTHWSQLTNPSTSTIPCVTDNQTDAVILGTLDFDNQTPNYTPDFYVNFNGIVAGGNLALGAGFGDGGQCITDGQDAYEGSAISPNWTDASWSAPIAIVIHNDIGPNNPDGNPNNLGPVELSVNSQSSDDYSATDQRGIINQINGPVMQLQLGRITP